MQFRNHALSNGLEIVAECNDEAQTSAVGFFVQTGARDENDAVSGVSHFLEHMVFKGTPKRSAEDVNRHFDEMGAHYNAFTSEEKTVYYAAVLPEYLKSAVELWSDVLRPSLRDEDFCTEKQVIIEEIKMYADQPPFGADDRVRAAHYGKHPLGRSVLGTVESITALDVEQMRGYFQQRYSPANIVVAATGRVDFDDLVATVERCCGAWSRFDAPRPIEPAVAHASFETVEKPSATQEYVIQLANAPSVTDPERFAAKILTTILGDDSGSRLYWELIDPGLAENASLGHHDYLGSGLFATYLSTAPEYVEENLQVILNIYREAEQHGVTAEELELAKSKINSRVVLSAERPRGRLFTVGANWSYRREYRSVKDDLATVDGIRLEHLRDVLQRWPLTQSTTIAIGPKAKVQPPK